MVVTQNSTGACHRSAAMPSATPSTSSAIAYTDQSTEIANCSASRARGSNTRSGDGSKYSSTSDVRVTITRTLSAIPSTVTIVCSTFVSRTHDRRAANTATATLAMAIASTSNRPLKKNVVAGGGTKSTRASTTAKSAKPRPAST